MDKWQFGSRVFGRIFTSFNIECALFVGLVVLLVFLVMASVRKNQLGPHVVRSYVMGQKVAEFTTTNPACICYRSDMFGRTVRTTNYYWRVWGVFK